MLKVIPLILVLSLVSGCDPNKIFGTRVTPMMGPDDNDKATVDYTLFKPRVVIAGETVEVAEVAALPGEAKYAGCIACHGMKGEGGVGPALQGQTADYIKQRLVAYKNGERVGRQSSMMWSQAGLLSDLDIEQLSEYIESL
jgi:cytochrome c553